MLTEARQALIDLIANSALTFETTKKYEGELTDSPQLNCALPACFVMFDDGAPMGNVPDADFELIVVTENRQNRKKKDETDNLSMIDNLAGFLFDSQVFGERLQYSIQQKDRRNVRTLLNNHRHTIRTLKITVRISRG
mgnify:CR=1 FL=1